MELRGKGLWTQKVGPEAEIEVELKNAHARGLGVEKKPEEHGQDSMQKAKGQDNSRGYEKVQASDGDGLVKVVKIK